MAPEGARLIPTLYKRGSKAGRHGSAVRSKFIYFLGGAVLFFKPRHLYFLAAASSAGGRMRTLLAAIFPFRSIPRS
jgi:hypothetical protein